MAQGSEWDLGDIRYYTQTSEIHFVEDNYPVDDLNANTLVVDNKAILAKSIADTATSDFASHRGSSGSAHGEVTDSQAGFISAGLQTKLGRLQPEAQLNVISPVDALELTGRGVTTLHRHPDVSSTLDGFMSSTQKSKLDTIQSGANANTISDSNALTLTGGPSYDANSLHSHTTPTFTETFTAAVHASTSHLGLPGVPAAFPTDGTGFIKSTYNLGPVQTGPGTTIFTQPYAFDLQVLDAGIASISESSNWGLFEEFRITSVSISGNNGIVVYQISPGTSPFGDMTMTCYQSAYGV